MKTSDHSASSSGQGSDAHSAHGSTATRTNDHPYVPVSVPTTDATAVRRRGRPPKAHASDANGGVAAASSPRPSRSAKPSASVPRLAGTASERARLTASAILEVLAGLRTPSDAATALGVAPVRYYQIECKALGGLLHACEPAQRGRPAMAPADAQRQADVERLRAEQQRLRHELARLQALMRTARAAFGLRPPEPAAPAKPAASGGRPKVIRKPRVRALRLSQIVRPTTGTASSEISGPATAADSSNGSAD